MLKKLIVLLVVIVLLVSVLSHILLVIILNKLYISIVSYYDLGKETNNTFSSIPLAASQIVNDQVNHVERASYLDYEWRIRVNYEEDKTGTFWCNDIQTKYAYLQKDKATCLADNGEWYLASVGEWCRPEEGEWFIVEPSDLEWYNAEPQLQLFDCAGYAPPMITIPSAETYSFIRTSLYLEEMKEGNNWW